MFKTIFLCTNIVYKHKSRCLRPFSSLKLTILLIFLKILFVEGLRAKFTKNRPEFPQFFENRPRDLQKSPKSQQIHKDKNLRIPKHIDFLKICRFLLIWRPKVLDNFNHGFFMYFLQNKIEKKTYVNL